MKKNVQMLLGFLCYVLGVVLSIYVGGIMMLLHPLQTIYGSLSCGIWDWYLLAVCGAKILLSTTVAGFVWCTGYIGWNYFKGTEDPDWESMEQIEQMEQ